MMPSLPNNYKHLNQAENFFKRDGGGQLHWLRLIYKIRICGLVGKLRSCCLGDMNLTLAKWHQLFCTSSEQKMKQTVPHFV